MKRIQYKDLTPPEKMLCKEFATYFGYEAYKYERIEQFTQIFYKKPGMYVRWIIIKNDNIHSIGKLRTNGTSFDVVNFQ